MTPRTPGSKEVSPLEWAIRYAALGWPVLPLAERSKIPITRNGLFDADTRPQIIRAWWSARPNANIGLRTGIAFDVIDVDGEIGELSLSETAPGWESRGPVSLTGKGKHYLIEPTQSRNRSNLLPKIDFRGINGYIVAPPSIHPSGHTYSWDTTRDWSTDIPTAPEWIKEYLLPWTETYRYSKPWNPYDPEQDLLRFMQNQGEAIKEDGNRHKMRCPLPEHRDSNPSFTIYPNNSWYCFGCDEGGDLPWLRKLLT